MKATYPAVLDLQRPFQDDHWARAGSGFEDFRKHGGRLDRESYEGLRAEVLERPSPAGAARLLLTGPERQDVHALAALPWVPRVEDLVRIGTDIEPALGADAPDLVLGPWADEPLERDVLAMATAEMLFAHLTGEPLAAWKRWRRRTPLPPMADRQAIYAVAAAPFTVWHIDEVNGDWLTVRECLGVADKFRCTRLRAPGRVSVDGGEQTLMARAVLDPDHAGGHAAAVAFTVGVAADEAELAAVLDYEWLRARFIDRRVSREQVLRTRGFVVARYVHELAFLAAEARGEPTAPAG